MEFSILWNTMYVYDLFSVSRHLLWHQNYFKTLVCIWVYDILINNHSTNNSKPMWTNQSATKELCNQKQNFTLYLIWTELVNSVRNGTRSHVNNSMKYAKKLKKLQFLVEIIKLSFGTWNVKCCVSATKVDVKKIKYKGHF